MHKKTYNIADLYDIVRRPIVTEKSTYLGQYNQYVFEVDRSATKTSVSSAVESIFKVDVEKVNVIVLKGKNKVFRGRKGRRSDIKKAIVTIKAGQTIDVTAGV